MSDTENDIRTSIVEAYSIIVATTSRLPTYADFIDYGISKSNIQTNFGNLTKLHEAIEEDYPDIITDNLTHGSVIFGKKRLEKLKSELRNYKRFFITTAVTNKKVFPEFYQTIKAYCEKNDALLLILGCSDVASTSRGKSWTFDPLLKDELFISEETQLNSRFFVSNIKMGAKQINPMTGMGRAVQQNGSCVYASPKQFLKIVATSQSKDSSSKAMMTPGAITVADYSTDRYLSERTSYFAEIDHVFGGIVVEIENDKTFHFRQIQSNDKGEFIDFGIRYYPDGSTADEEVHLVLGDWHSGTVDKKMKKIIAKMASEVHIGNVFVHDLFDGKSINHHEMNEPLKRGKLLEAGKISLEKELIATAEDLKFIGTLCNKQVVVVKSNHDEFLDRYLSSGAFIKDPSNVRVASTLVEPYFHDQNVLKVAVEKYGNIDTEGFVVWLERDDDFKIAGIELGAHGDKGSNGSPGTTQSIETAFGMAVVGHLHSGEIMRGVWRVGVSGDLDHGYNIGPSSWTQTHCFVANDGSRQLINVINGKYRA